MFVNKHKIGIKVQQIDCKAYGASMLTVCTCSLQYVIYMYICIHVIGDNSV